MRSTTLLTLLISTLPIAVAAKPCVNHSTATDISATFASLITSYNNRTALSVLSPNFADYSDSVNTLIDAGCPNGPNPLGTPTFSSRAQFMAAQVSQASIPFEVLNVWHGCGSVIMRWRSNAPVKGGLMVTGITVMEVDFVGEEQGVEGWVIKTVFAENNSAVWLYDLGVFVPKC